MVVHTQPADMREKILQEAERLFRHYGYSKTTMADIAEACHTSPANLYRFFASKSALIEGLCEKISAQEEYELSRIAHSGEMASRRIELFAEMLYKHTLENLLDHRKVHEMVVVAMEENWGAVKAHLDRMRSLIEQVIMDGIASGEFRQQDAGRAAAAVQSAMLCCCHPVVVAQKLEDETRATPTEIASLIVNSLKAQV
jgi:AcrR family transcriptional regulator